MATKDDDEQKVYIKNNSKASVVIPGVPRNVELAAGRVTEVNATVWEKFKESPFGKSLVEDEALEEATEEEHETQPETPEQAAEREESSESDTEATPGGRRRHGKKHDET